MVHRRAQERSSVSMAYLSCAIPRMRETDVHGMTCSSAHVPDKPKEADGQEDASNRGQIQPSASDLSVIVNH